MPPARPPHPSYRDPGVQLPEPPNDDVVQMCWSSPPKGANIKFRMKGDMNEANNQMRLAVASWDGELRVYNVQCGPGLPEVAAYRLFKNPAPLMCCCVDQGGVAFSGDVLGIIRMHDIEGNTTREIGSHEGGPVVEMLWDYMNGLVISGGFDGKIKAWNGQSSQPVETLSVNGRIRALTMIPGWIGAVDHHSTIHLFNMENKDCRTFTFQDLKFSHLQVTQINLQPKKNYHYSRNRPMTNLEVETIIITSADGRGAIFDPSKIKDATQTSGYGKQYGLRNYAGGNDQARIFTWRISPLLAETDNYGSSNELFQSSTNTMVTAPRGLTICGGSDGRVRMFRCSLQVDQRGVAGEIQPQRLNWPITSGAVDPWSRFYAFSQGYDWSRGVANINRSDNPIVIYVKPFPDEIQWMT